MGDEGDPPLRKPGPNSATAPGATGPVAGLKVIEMGADVARVDGPSAMPLPGSQPAPPYGEVMLRDTCFAPVLTPSDTAKHAPSPAPVRAVPDGAGDPPRRYPP